MKTIDKWITAEKFVKLVKDKFDIDISLSQVNKMGHGEQLCMIRNEEKMTETSYFFRKHYFKTFTLGYSLHEKIKEGKEIMISNIPFPRGPVQENSQKKK